MNRAMRFLLPILWVCLASAPIVIGAATQTRPLARNVDLGLSVTSVKPPSVELVRGGAAVEVTLEGRNVHRADLHGEALQSGKVKHGILVCFDKPGASGRRVLKLSALAQAAPGAYVIRLRSGNQGVDLRLPVQVRAATAADLTHGAAQRGVESASRGRVLRGSAAGASRRPVAGAVQGARAITARNILAGAAGVVKIIPSLVVQTGTREFEGYARAIGFATPERLTFQWSHDNPEVAFGRWEVTHDNFVVMKGSTGAAPAPGQTKKFDIDFTRFVNLPAPDNPVRYSVRVRGKKALAQGPLTAVQVGAEDESSFVTPSSNAVVVTYAKQPDTVFTEEGIPEEDADHDLFRDQEENALAAQFRPYFIFDAEESFRLPNEPVVIFQAHCLQGAPAFCTHAQIKYYYLFREDGGWQSCSPWCNNAHNGDNQSVTIEVFRHLPEANNPYMYWWFGWGADRYDYTHPVLYLSAGKHHDYVSTSWNHSWDDVCCDDVAGDGDQVFPDVKTGDRYHNVGEPNYHLIDDLTFLGYPGECAWCGKPFRGGLEDDEGDSSPFSWL